MNRGMHALRWILALTAALAATALVFGCQKRPGADAAASVAEKQLIRNPTEPPALAEEPATPDPASPEELRVPPLLMVKLHDEFMNQGPKQGYEYREAGDLLVNDLLPGGQQPISEIIRQFYQGAAGSGDLEETTYRKQSIANFLKSPVFPLKTEEDSALESSAIAQAQAAASSPDSQWQNALSPALRPVGDWKSFKEVREYDKDYVVNHDDKYYKLLVIGPLKDGLGSFSLQEHSDGKLSNRVQQPYRLDEATGTISLLSDEGGTYMTFVVRQMADEGDILYMKTAEDFVYTVYRRMSGVGGEADTAAFESKGGTNARGGSNQPGQ